MFKIIFVTFIGILLLNAMIVVTAEVNGLHQFKMMPYLQLNILHVLFGVLIQWKKVESILDQKSVHVDRLFWPAFLLMIISMIPEPLWFNWLQPITDLHLFTAPLYHIETNTLIGVLSGILFVQSLDNKNET